MDSRETMTGHYAAAPTHHDPRTGRRTFLRGAAALGLAMPAAFKLHSTLGQDPGTPTPGHEGHDGGYVGSAGHTGGGTGDATPAPITLVPYQRYDPMLPQVEPGEKHIELTVVDNIIHEISPKVLYAGWTFNSTIPGPMLRVVEGDTVNVTFKVREDATWHSLDFHAAQTSPDVNYRSIGPGETLTYSYTPNYPGSFMYHCGTPPVLMHIGAGMYGGIIVDPKEGWSPAQEIFLVQSEFYLADPVEGTTVHLPDYQRMLTQDMTYCVFNGHATQYVDEPIKVKVGEPIRIFVVNAGPNVFCTFHVVGAIFDAAYFNANPKNKIVGQQSMSVGPGDGMCVELTLHEPGIYPAVNHAFGHAAHGAIALLHAE
jgi:nitrite reductase (NO-forming)